MQKQSNLFVKRNTKFKTCCQENFLVINYNINGKYIWMPISYHFLVFFFFFFFWLVRIKHTLEQSS